MPTFLQVTVALFELAFIFKLNIKASAKIPVTVVNTPSNVLPSKARGLRAENSETCTLINDSTVFADALKHWQHSPEREFDAYDSEGLSTATLSL
jgi:hypothetical protein